MQITHSHTPQPSAPTWNKWILHISGGSTSCKCRNISVMTVLSIANQINALAAIHCESHPPAPPPLCPLISPAFHPLISHYAILSRTPWKSKSSVSMGTFCLHKGWIKGEIAPRFRTCIYAFSHQEAAIVLLFFSELHLEKKFHMNAESPFKDVGIFRFIRTPGAATSSGIIVFIIVIWRHWLHRRQATSSQTARCLQRLKTGSLSYISILIQFHSHK